MVPVVRMAMVIRGEAGLEAHALRKQQALFHRQVLLEIPNLLLNLHHGVLHPFRRDDAQRVHRRDQIVVGLAEFTVVSNIAGCPVELLRIHLDPQRLSGCLTGHLIPGAQSVNDDHRQHNGRDDRPHQLESVVVREKGGFAVFVVGVLPSEDKQQCIDQDEDRRDDPDVEAHQGVHGRTMLRSGRRGIVTIGPVEVGSGGKEHCHEHQEEIRVELGVRMGDVLLTATRDAG